MNHEKNNEVSQELALRIVENRFLQEIDEGCAEMEKKGHEFVLKPISKEEVRDRFFGDARNRTDSEGSHGFAKQAKELFKALTERFQVTGIRAEFAQTDDEGLIEIMVRYGNAQVPLWASEDEEDHAIEFYSTDGSLIGKRLVIANSKINWKIFCEFISDTSSRDFAARSLLSPGSLALPVAGAVKELEIFISDNEDSA